MTKELTSLEVSKQLKDFVLEFVKNGLDRRFIHGSFDIIEKELKALEIILTKDVDVGAFKKLVFGRISLTDKEKLDYWNDIHNNKIAMEEYDLLKEIL